jgi:hypothetical protein
MRRIGGALELALRLRPKLSAADFRVLPHFRFCVLDDPLDPRNQLCRQSMNAPVISPMMINALSVNWPSSLRRRCGAEPTL